MRRSLRILLILLFSVISPFATAQEPHGHSVPEKLGTVSFPISCAPAVRIQFDRGVALLHSFAYSAAKDAFQGVAALCDGPLGNCHDVLSPGLGPAP
jgi:hypothetical protein